MRQALERVWGRCAPYPNNPLCLALPAVCLLARQRTITLPPAIRLKLPPAVETGGSVLCKRGSVVTVIIPPCIAAVVAAKGLFAGIGAVGQRLAAVAALAGVAVFPHIPAPFRIKASSSQGSTNANIPLSVSAVLCWICSCKLSRSLAEGTIHTTIGNTPLSLCSMPAW